ncbi:MAG: hypothetical protein AABY73_10495 [Pseudomonadota bacterium]
MKNRLIRIPISGLLRTALWAALGMVCFVSAPAVTADPIGVCKDPRGCTPDSNSGSGGGGGGYNGPNLWNWLRNSGPSAADQADQQAHTANQQGVQAYNKGDWATAISLFQQTLQNSPDDPVIRKNLANAQANMANQQARERQEREAMERQRQNKAAADNMQQSIQNFAQTLNAAPVSGGLDFDARTAGVAPSVGNSGGLDFTAAIAMPSQAKPALASPSGDPKVVDARKVPSGLPKDVENTIAGMYQNAPPGVSDRVRKGFQAVMDRDWKAAKAWFEDALNRDPGNVGLKRFVALAGHTPERNRQAAPSTAGPVSEPRPPRPDDVYYYVPSRGYDRMTLEDATLRQVWDETLGIPPGSIINIR